MAEQTSSGPRRASALARTAVLLALPLLLAACPWSQRIDRRADGQVDAASCVTQRGGDAARAASQCERRGFYDSPDYRAGWLAVTECVKQAGGSAAPAAERCLARL